MASTPCIIGLRGAVYRLARIGLLFLVAGALLVACNVRQHGVGTPERPITPTPLTSAQIFDKISPSIAFIKTADHQGAGVLIEGGHILTNAEIVWPYHTVRVLFPDGSEYLDVPVKGLDFIADLAVLGPIIGRSGALEFVDGEGLSNGTKIFVIGYPEATGDFPQPTIISRRLASVQHSESAGISYLQTNAIVASEQSGWVLVSGSGDVIGVLGLWPTNINFEVAVSSADILPRARQLLAGADLSQLGDRRIPVGGGQLRHEVELEHFLAQRSYVLDELPGTSVDLGLAGEGEGRLRVTDSHGSEVLVLLKEKAAAAAGTVNVERAGPLFLTVWRLAKGPGDYTLSGSHPLIAFEDPDDGRRIQVGHYIPGNIDFPGDIDHYVFELSQGETVDIVASSRLGDIVLNVYPLGSYGQIVFEFDGASLLSRMDASTVFRAPRTGSYIAVVVRESGNAPGGYILWVRPDTR